MNTAPEHLVILASAGTGKTHALTSRFLRLVADGELPERILATTFTRKAAGEILRKAVERVAKGASSEADAARLGREIGSVGLDAAGCTRILRVLARSLGRLSIGTIDSFFARLAAGFSLSLGRGAGQEWRMIDEGEDEELRSEAVSCALRQAEQEEILSLVRTRSAGSLDRSVHAELMSAVGEAYEAYLRTPGAAWGALRIDPPLEKGRVAEAVSRLKAMPLPTTKTGTPMTRWSKAHKEALDAALAGDWDAFISTGIACRVICGDESYDKATITEAHRAAYAPLTAHAGSVLLSTLPARTRATHRMLQQFDLAYRRLKESRGVCTFDDVPRMLLAAPGGLPLEEMYYRLDARVRHLLLDEFQDTSVAQWRLLEPLAHEIVSQGVDRSLLCVGDVKQSLYSWRRAEPELLPSIARRWPQVKSESRAASYRSSAVVIETVNEIMGSMARNGAFTRAGAHAGDTAAAAQWEGMFEPHTTEMNLPGWCRISVTHEPEEGSSHEDVALQEAAERIARLQEDAPTRTIGVLFRSKKHIAAMKHELQLRRVHASEEGGNPLADSAPVAAALSMLTLADHPGNTAAIFHVAGTPLGAALGVAYPATHADVCRAASRLRGRLLSEGFAGVLEEWFRRIAGSCSAAEARRFDQLVSLGERFDRRSDLDPTTRATAFVEFARSQRVEDPTAAPVRLMTMHASKGLEFDVVVLPWLGDRIGDRTPPILEDRPVGDLLADATLVTLTPPKGQLALHPKLMELYARWRSREVLEQLCVLYVALTRAVHALEIFVSPTAKSLDEDDGTTLSFAKIVRGAVCRAPLEAGTVAWSMGDPEWMTEGNVAVGAHGQGGVAAHIPKITLDLEEGSRRRHVPRRTPAAETDVATGSDGEDGQRAGDPSMLGDGERGAARARGILIHAWLEQIAWLEDGVPDEEALLALARRLELPETVDVQTAAREFAAMLRRSPLKELLSRSGYSARRAASLEECRELPFVLAERGPKGAPCLVAGRLDRLVVGRDAAGGLMFSEVVDFKTDLLVSHAPPALSRHAARYRGQMGDYRRAVSRLLGCDAGRVGVKLVFVTHGVVMEA